MSDETKVNAEEAAPKPKRWPIVLSVFVVMVIAVLVAFLHWHEVPSFCNTFCHQPMDRYVEGYYSEDPALSAANHAEEGVTCLGCHWSQAKMLDLAHELALFATDGFTDPLEDKVEIASDAFCGACHDGTTAKTKEGATAGSAYDPHAMPANAGHENVKIECSDCHKVHKQSTFACASCHADADIPAKWAVPATDAAKAAASAAAIEAECADPHAMTDTAMHALTGITCASCHEAKVNQCAACHTDAYVPAGWTEAEESHAKAYASENFEDEGYIDVHATGEDLPDFHQEDGIMALSVTCSTCHAQNVLYCTMCHAIDEELLPAGWTEA